MDGGRSKEEGREGAEGGTTTDVVRTAVSSRVCCGKDGTLCVELAHQSCLPW